MLFRWLVLSTVVVGGPALSADHRAALELYRERRYAEAQQQFESAVAQHDQDPVAHHYLGKLARLRQDLPTAITHLEKALALAPDDPGINYDYGAVCSLHADTLGMSFRAASYARRGRVALERAVELAPDELKYRQALLEFYSSAPGIVGGSLAKAYAQAEAIRARDETQGTFALANLKVQEKAYTEALALWIALVEQEPDNTFALFHLGRTAALSGQEIERGIAALQRCLTLPVPESGQSLARVHWRLGQLRVLQNDLAGARAAFRAALAIEPNNERMAADLARLPPEQ